MHWNTGYQAEAMPLLSRFVEQFRGAEAVVVPSSSCVAMMRDHYLKMAVSLADERLIADVEALLPKVFEFLWKRRKMLGKFVRALRRETCRLGRERYYHG